jgi:DNA polymerase/3'-5' exonuclease PolX
MKNQQIANVFNEIATLLELKGDNPFRMETSMSTRTGRTVPTTSTR